MFLENKGYGVPCAENDFFHLEICLRGVTEYGEQLYLEANNEAKNLKLYLLTAKKLM